MSKSKSLKVKIDGKTGIARTEREQILAATYSVAVKTLSRNTRKADVVRWMNSTFETDFTLGELLDYLDYNTPNEDYELESRKHQMRMK